MSDSNKNEGEIRQYLGFSLNGQRYGLPIGSVKEISTVAEVTTVPRVPKFVLGVMNLRGKIIPVIDLRVRFEVEVTPFTRDTCIVIVEGIQGEVGLVVDKVEEVLNFVETQVKAPPAMGSEAFMKYVNGIARFNDELVMLVDVQHVMSFQEFQDVLSPTPEEAA
ncbi:MAG: purine-binding chemotaxis protein CheW [Bdellovibrionales bacterium]|nr:purine-binding chemotaxis protein CheW [Bdellovibrionales bacterium]